MWKEVIFTSLYSHLLCISWFCIKDGVVGFHFLPFPLIAFCSPFLVSTPWLSGFYLVSCFSSFRVFTALANRSMRIVIVSRLIECIPLRLRGSFFSEFILAFVLVIFRFCMWRFIQTITCKYYTYFGTHVNIFSITSSHSFLSHPSCRNVLF